MTKGDLLLDEEYLVDDVSEKIEEFRREFNEAFIQGNIDLNVNADFKVTNSRHALSSRYDEDKFCIDDVLTAYEEIDDTILNKFFVFPSHSLYFYDGIKRKEFGLRICIIKKNKKGIVQRVIDVKSKAIKGWGFLPNGIKKKWRLSGGLDDSYKIVFDQIAKRVSEKGPSIIYTSQTGWVEGAKNWFYVPVIAPDRDDLLYLESLNSKYRIGLANTQNGTSRQETFERVLEMLDIADKKITIPLLSYTFLSLVTSMFKYDQFEMRKFALCISGTNKVLSNKGFANLFCNIYDRKTNVLSISSRFHANSDLEQKQLEKKSSQIRDGIFIINAESRPKMVKRALELNANYSFENMLLLLNEGEIDREFVLNLNIAGLDVNAQNVEKLRQETDTLTICIYFLTEYFRTIFKHQATGTKSKVEKYFRKRCNYYQNRIEDTDRLLETDKVQMYSCLLVGYELFLSIGNDEPAMFWMENHYEKSSDRMDEAVQLFQIASAIKSEVDQITLEKKNEELEESSNEKYIRFLNKLIEITEGPLPSRKEKNHTPDSVGWNLEANNDVVLVRNGFFTTILKELGNDFDSKDETVQKQETTRFKKQIYQRLYADGIIHLTKDKEDSTKLSVSFFEEQLKVGSRQTKTEQNIYVFRFDRKMALEYLEKFGGTSSKD